MIELNITYQQALTLLDFLSIRIEAVGEKEPDIVQVRNNLLMELDNYEQASRMLIGQ